MRRALESLGVEVVALQEDGYDWTRLQPDTDGADLFLWTRTGQFDPPDLSIEYDAVHSLNIPTVGYHLDRWWGLNREPTIFEHPFFTLDYVCTADGGHDPEWKAQGVNHHWYPPAILAEEAQLGEARTEYLADIGFVGNMTGYAHPEWGPYRRRLYKYLANRYRRSFRVFPTPGKPAIRGKALQDLYASVKVLVGDSCLAGGIERYWSDRIPETTGRGGFLIHPHVLGLAGQHPDLVTYPLDDFAALTRLIDSYLRDPDRRGESARINREHTLKYHTYQRRMGRLLEEVL